MQTGFDFTAQPRRESAAPREMTIQERFDAYHKANPHVLVALVRWAREERSKGVGRLSVKRGWEALRADRDFEVTHGGAFKADNRLTAPFARAMLKAAPELEGMIELRGAKGQKRAA